MGLLVVVEVGLDGGVLGFFVGRRLDLERCAPFLAALTKVTRRQRNIRAKTGLSLIFSRTQPRSNCEGEGHSLHCIGWFLQWGIPAVLYSQGYLWVQPPEISLGRPDSGDSPLQ